MVIQIVQVHHRKIYRQLVLDRIADMQPTALVHSRYSAATRTKNKQQQIVRFKRSISYNYINIIEIAMVRICSFTTNFVVFLFAHRPQYSILTIHRINLKKIFSNLRLKSKIKFLLITRILCLSKCNCFIKRFRPFSIHGLLFKNTWHHFFVSPNWEIKLKLYSYKNTIIIVSILIFHYLCDSLQIMHIR